MMGSYSLLSLWFRLCPSLVSRLSLASMVYDGFCSLIRCLMLAMKSAGDILISFMYVCFLHLSYRVMKFFCAFVIPCFIVNATYKIWLEDFAKVFENQGDVGLILMEHLAIRRTLRIISHRFRGFVLSTLVLVTASQFASLLVTTRTGSLVNISTAGELAVVTSLFTRAYNLIPEETSLSDIVGEQQGWDHSVWFHLHGGQDISTHHFCT
ncbi:hypothetical protein L1987_05284 [Smallanthus sonchifolius]|uniref:Uncharacterized protein n=1 Tax=Smallanthus sonchifolius TaxID=185202 RepID=A0ACB9JUY0_9ASTR|nr:hypothetical protein L1987_05284 [Smallanthus sonchifolius]